MNTSNTQSEQWLTQMEAGKQCFRRNDITGAAKAFNEATRLQPHRLEGWVNLGSTLLQGQRYEDAAGVLQQAITLNKNVPVAHMLLGDAQRMQGQTDAAFASYEASVKLERSPMALNRLACALRSRHRRDEAYVLYHEALDMEPRFTLAKVNLATLHIESQDFREAQLQLESLSETELPATERAEVQSALHALAEFQRLEPAINALADTGDCSELETLLGKLPRKNRGVDEDALVRARLYQSFARKAAQPVSHELQPLPEEWPLIEALFMIPLADDVDEYRALRDKIRLGKELTDDMRESLNIEPAIRRARGDANAMQTPAAAEARLRHWHLLAGREVRNFHPGHFKYTQNWTNRNPTLKRVDPALASATFQHFMQEIYPTLPPGMLRAAISFLVLCDLHCFGDGNGRIATIWLNRELEWNGLMPALFRSDSGLKGELAKAMSVARNSGGDLTHLLNVIERAQAFAASFCTQLDAR